MSYENTAGLGVLNHYGARVVESERAGVVGTKGALNEYRKTFDYSDVVGNAASVAFSDINLYEPAIPSGAIITKATLMVTTAFVGASATLNIGLYYNNSGALGTIDADGIDATIAVTAIDADGDLIACDGAYVSNGSNTTAKQLANAAYIICDSDTADFTAGAAELLVEYYVPVVDA